MPKLDLTQIERRTGSIYPGSLNALMEGRSSLRLGDAGGLTQFGVNLVFLEPGGASSMRHYHMEQDEFAMVTQGALVLVDNDGEHPMLPGDCVAWPAGDPNGHKLVNRTDEVAAFLVVGTKTQTETAYYSDRDLMVQTNGDDIVFTKKDGSPLDDDI